MKWYGKQLNEWIRRNGTLKLFSLAFACGLWLLVNAGERDAEKTLVVPVEIRNLSSQLVIVGPRIEYVDLRVSGPRTLLGRLNSKKVTLDLTGVRPGQAAFRIGSDRLSLPRGVKLVRISPSQITLDIARMIRRTVPVRVGTMGKPPYGFELKGVEVVPDFIEVTGPAPQVEKLETVKTESVDIGRLTQALTQTIDLQGPEGELVTYDIAQVRARIDIQEVMLTRELRRVKIEIKNADLPATVTPVHLDLTVRGAQRLVEKLQLNDGAVFVDAGGVGPGTVSVPVNVILPPGIEIVAQEPQEVTLKIVADGKEPPAEPKKSRGIKRRSGA